MTCSWHRRWDSSATDREHLAGSGWPRAAGRITESAVRDISPGYDKAWEQFMAGRLQDKTALVTGATSNIGRAIAEAFAAEGAHVVISGRSAQRGAQVVEGIRSRGGRADFVIAELDGSAEASRALAEQATSVLGGRIDILVNNAGIYPGSPARTGARPSPTPSPPSTGPGCSNWCSRKRRLPGYRGGAGLTRQPDRSRPHMVTVQSVTCPGTRTEGPLMSPRRVSSSRNQALRRGQRRPVPACHDEPAALTELDRSVAPMPEEIELRRRAIQLAARPRRMPQLRSRRRTDRHARWTFCRPCARAGGDLPALRAQWAA